MVKRATAVLLIASLSVAAACAPAAPTPTRTPEPMATPVELLATEPDHVVGTWYNAYREFSGGDPRYYRFESDGTIYWAATPEDLQKNPEVEGRFWFEDGVYYEEGYTCEPVGSYRVFVAIEGGRAVRPRFEEIEDSARDCFMRIYEKAVKYVRVD